MVWTLMFHFAISLRKPSAKETAAYFDMEYGVNPGTVTRPDRLVTMTMRPCDCFRNGRNDLVTSTTPRALTSSICLYTSMGHHSISDEQATPALLTTAHNSVIHTPRKQSINRQQLHYSYSSGDERNK